MGLGKMSKLAKVRRFLCIGLILPLALSCSTKPKQQEYVTVGAILSLTGEPYLQGVQSACGLHVAWQEINAEGGILGKKADFFIFNDKGDVDYAIQQYNALKEIGVIGIIGSNDKKVAAAIAKVAEKDGMPYIAPGNLTLEILARYDDSPNNRIPDVEDDGAIQNMAPFADKYYRYFSQKATASSIATYACTHLLALAINTIGSDNKEEITSIIKINRDKILGRTVKTSNIDKQTELHQSMLTHKQSRS